MFKLALVFGLVTLTVASFQEECLNTHNKYRRWHSAAPLKLDENLMEIAQKAANFMAKNQLMEYRVEKYGTNTLFTRGAKGVTGATAVDFWYEEMSDYNPKKPAKSGHFTQVVWRGSTDLGCAYGVNGDDVYIVAVYNPAGNLDGQFAKNVK